MKITTLTPEDVSISASQNANVVTFNDLGSVTVHDEPSNVLGMRRAEGDDLIIKMRNGETILIKDYYGAPGNLEIYFEDGDGKLWVAENILGTEQFTFVAVEQEEATGMIGGAGWGILGALGLLGAAAGGGGSSDSDDDDDTTAPNAPTVELASDTGSDSGDGITNDGTVTVGGIEDGATWEHSTDGGETWTEGSGDSFTLPEGEYDEGDVLVRQTDEAGNTSEESGLGAVTVDQTAPDPVEIGSVMDDVGTVTGELDSGVSTDDTAPTLSGSGGTPGDTITLYDGDTVVGTATVGSDGNWSVTPSTPLSEGSHSLTVTATDPAGNESGASGAFEVVVTATAPDAISIGSVIDDVGSVTGALVSGGVTDDTRPTVSGTGAEAGQTVTLYANGVAVGSTVAGADGSWSVEPTNPLGDGDYDLTVTVTDLAGNVSAHSDGFAVEVDTQAPATPSIGGVADDDGTAIEDGDSTNDDTPTFSGSGGEPGDTVTLYDGDEEIGSGTVDDEGNWEITPEDPLDEGEHDLHVTITDPAGNESDPSDDFTVIVDTTAPDAPELDDLTVTDDVGAVQGELSSGDETDDTVPTISGTGGAEGDIATLYVDGVAVGTAVVDASGNWSIEPGTALAEGDHELTVTYTDAAGNESDPSAAFDLTVDTTAPDAPDMSGVTVTDDVGAVQGELSSGDSTDDTKPTFSGTGGTEGDTVTLYADGVAVGTGIVAADGSWSVEPETPLGDGDYDLTLTFTDPAGNESDPSDAFELTVTNEGPDAPEVSDITVYDDVGEVQGELSSGDTTDDAKPTVSGIGGAEGHTATLYVDGVAVGTAVVDASGNWSIEPGTDLAEGAHELTVTYTDAAGNEGPASDVFDLTVDTTAPDAPEASDMTVYDDVGEVQGELSSGDTTDDTIPTVSGTGGAEGDTVTLYVDGVAVGTGVVAADGSWSVEPGTALAEGDYELTVTYTDAAGNESDPSDVFDLTVDTTAPDAPEESSMVVTDDVGPVQGELSSGDTTDDATPTFSGTGGTEGDTVTLYADGVAVGTGVVAADGSWSVVPAEGLEDGDYELTVTFSDPAGNESEATDPFELTVLTSVPSALTIDEVYDDVGVNTGALVPGAITDDSRPTVSGSGATEGDLVTLYANGVAVGSATADADGNWEISPDSPLGNGAYDLTATATNAAGVEGSESSVFPVTVSVVDLETADNSEVLALDVTPTAVPVADENLASYTGFTIAGVGVGGILNLDALAGLGVDIEDISIDVAENTTQQITLKAQAGGITVLADFGLYVYKLNEDTGEYELYQSHESWLSVYLLGGSSDELTLTFEEGTYAFVLAQESGVAVTTGYTLETLSSTIFDYNTPVHVEGTLSGNVITDTDAVAGLDDLPEGTVISEVNGTDVAITGSTQIVGDYGTLTIYADGSYSYEVNEDFTGPYGSVDEFEYTVLAPNGAEDSATLSITLELGDGGEVVAADANIVLDLAPSVTDYGDESPIEDISNFTLLELVGAGDQTILNASVLDLTGQMAFTVDEGTVRELTFEGWSASVSIAADYDLLIYKLDEVTGNYALFHKVDSWLQVGLFIGRADSETVSFPEGEYFVTFAGGSTVGLLTGVNLSVSGDVIYDYGSPATEAGTVIGTTSGDLTEDAGLTVTKVNGAEISESGATTVEGEFGTLVINPDGTYTYTITVPEDATGWEPPYGQMETFSYSTVNEAGKIEVGTINISIDMVEAVDDSAEVQVEATNVVDVTSVDRSYSTILGGDPEDSVTVTVSDDPTKMTVVTASFSIGDPGADGTLTYRVVNTATSETVAGTSGSFAVTDGVALSETVTFDDLPAGEYEVIFEASESQTLGSIRGEATVTTTVTDIDEYVLTENTVTGNILDNDAGEIGEALFSITIGEDMVATGDYVGAETMEVAGLYGTLTVNADGSYSYVADGSGYGEDVFEYTLTSAAGTTETATLTINVGMNVTGSGYGDMVTSTAGDDSFAMGAGADTVSYEALDAGNGSDTWTDFSAAEGDTVDLTGLLDGVAAEDVGGYVQLQQDGDNTVVAYDATGTGENFSTLLTLTGVSTTDVELEDGLVQAAI